FGKTKFAMGVTECKRDLCDASGRVVENIAAQNWNQFRLVKGFGTPAQRSPGEIGKITDGQRLRMAAVAPIGDKITQRAVYVSSPGGGTQICQRVVVPANQCLPGRSAGADVEWNFRPGKCCSFFFKWMIRFITPI